MDKALYTWLSQYVRFDSIDFKSNIGELIVDMFISDKCNLCCKHCYFGETRTIAPRLTTQDWKKVIGSLHAEGVRHFHISGRESSLDNRVLEIISFIKSLEGTYSGLVSNGTGHLVFYNSLIEEGIDYLEFSIDGTEDTHNYIRGSKVFSQIMNTLQSLSQHSNIIDISTCLNKNSIDDYFMLVDKCLEFGIKKFFATPFLPKGNGESFGSFSLTPELFSQLIKNSFAYLESKEGQKIVIKYCIPHEITIPMIETGEYFRQLLVNYLTNKSELVYHINGNLIQVALNLLDVKYMNNISITSDGEVIPCADYISDINYHRHSIGNVSKVKLSDIIQARDKEIMYNLNTLLNEN